MTRSSWAKRRLGATCLTPGDFLPRATQLPCEMLQSQSVFLVETGRCAFWTAESNTARGELLIG